MLVGFVGGGEVVLVGLGGGVGFFVFGGGGGVGFGRVGVHGSAFKRKFKNLKALKRNIKGKG